jgi:hypothetical protein
MGDFYRGIAECPVRDKGHDDRGRCFRCIVIAVDALMRNLHLVMLLALQLICVGQDFQRMGRRYREYLMAN